MSYDNPRIKLEMSTMDIVMAMAEGNPGAISVLMSMLAEGRKIDPDDFLAPLGAILSLDTHDIYGSRIWMLFKDVCKQDLPKTLALLRAVDFGYLAEKDLAYAIDHYGAGVDADAMLKKVQERLPQFAKAEVPA